MNNITTLAAGNNLPIFMLAGTMIAMMLVAIATIFKMMKTETVSKAFFIPVFVICGLVSAACAIGIKNTYSATAEKTAVVIDKEIHQGTFFLEADSYKLICEDENSERYVIRVTQQEYIDADIGSSVSFTENTTFFFGKESLPFTDYSNILINRTAPLG